MKIIQDHETIQKYHRQHSLHKYFNFDILPYTLIMQYEAGETMISEGDTLQYLFFLIEGRAKLFMSRKDGNVSLINILKAPAFIGEMEFLEAQQEANGVVCITPCLCFAINVRICKEKLLNDFRFLRLLCLALGKKALQSSSTLIKNQSYPLKVRLADHILLTSYENIYLERHKETAEYLGVTYRHLLYVIAEFCQKGILIRLKKGYRIEKKQELEDLAFILYAETGQVQKLY